MTRFGDATWGGGRSGFGELVLEDAAEGLAREETGDLVDEHDVAHLLVVREL